MVLLKFIEEFFNQITSRSKPNGLAGNVLTFVKISRLILIRVYEPTNRLSVMSLNAERIVQGKSWNKLCTAKQFLYSILYYLLLNILF